MSWDIMNEVITDIKSISIKVSLSLIKSTDVSNCSKYRIVLVRHFHGSAAKTEESLLCEELKTCTVGKEVCHLVKDFFAKHDLDISTIGSVCADDPSALLRNKAGFYALMKREVTHLKIIVRLSIGN